MKEMLSLINEAEKVLTSPDHDLDEFGHLLNYAWQLKRRIGRAISTNSIDLLYEQGIKAGAIGGKLLGAGGGGFLVFYVQPEKRKDLQEAMKDLLHVPFRFEDGGTRVIHYSPEYYSNKREQ